jgi:hypothetical protein
VSDSPSTRHSGYVTALADVATAKTAAEERSAARFRCISSLHCLLSCEMRTLSSFAYSRLYRDHHDRSCTRLPSVANSCATNCPKVPSRLGLTFNTKEQPSEHPRLMGGVHRVLSSYLTGILPIGGTPALVSIRTAVGRLAWIDQANNRIGLAEPTVHRPRQGRRRSLSSVRGER